MKKGAVAALILLLAGAGGAAGWYYYNDGSFLPAQESKETVYVTSVSTLMGRISGAENRFAGVVEAQETVAIQKDPDRKVSEVKVQVGDEVTAGQILFEYDLSSIQDKLAEARLDLERLQNEALNYTNQISTYETERQKKENANRQLDLLIDIQTAQLNLKKNEYDQKSKEAEIVRLENATGNTQVTSEINGIIQKIDTSKLSSTDESSAVTNDLEESGYSSGTDSGNDAFITILSTGEYRVKGTVNELNRDEIIPGEGAIIRSRADETEVWHGIMGSVDSKNSKTSDSDAYSGGDSMTSSSSYPFYVELDGSEGLMLGQHVYIERDIGQEEQKSGIWLSEDFIVDADTENPFVWAADEDSRLVKKSVTLGEHEEYELKYEILDGLTEDDYIAFPTSGLSEGLPTKPGTPDQAMTQAEYGDYGDEMYEEDSAMYDDMDYMDDQDMAVDPFDAEVVEVFDDTAEWPDDGSLDWDMDESTGDEPYVIEGEDVYVVDDLGTDSVEITDDGFNKDDMGNSDNMEVIEDFPEDMEVIEDFPEDMEAYEISEDTGEANTEGS